MIQVEHCCFLFKSFFSDVIPSEMNCVVLFISETGVITVANIAFSLKYRYKEMFGNATKYIIFYCYQGIKETFTYIMQKTETKTGEEEQSRFQVREKEKKQTKSLNDLV